MFIINIRGIERERGRERGGERVEGEEEEGEASMDRCADCVLLGGAWPR